MAAYLAEQIVAASDFELLAAPQLSICCFRYVPKSLATQLGSLAASGESSTKLNAQLDQLNTNIMNTVQRGGRAYLSSASIRGKFALRVCITNFRTTRADIDETLEIIREAARKHLAAD